jgi:undecaprenyl-diphosphatase
MDILEIIVLGIVQAITEWLPLSSKSADSLVYLYVFGGSLEKLIPVLLFLHLGTLIAAIIYFRKDLYQIFKQTIEIIKGERQQKQKAEFLFFALLCTGIVGLPLLIIEKYILSLISEKALQVLIGIGLIITGFLLTTKIKEKTRKIESINAMDGIITGILQGFSVLPGISRAGTTTAALIWRGFDSKAALYYSFLLSIPTILIAEILFFSFQNIEFSFIIQEGIYLMLSSLIFGYITIDILLKLSQKINPAFLAFIFGMIILISTLI